VANFTILKSQLNNILSEPWSTTRGELYPLENGVLEVKYRPLLTEKYSVGYDIDVMIPKMTD
jgi:hypothetical protein